MRGNHQLFPVFLILIAGLLFAGVSWAQKGSGSSSFQGFGNDDANNFLPPGEPHPKSKAATDTPQKSKRPNSQVPKLDRYGSDPKKSSRRDLPKAEQSLTVENLRPNVVLGAPSPQSTTSTSYFDGLLSRSIKDLGKARKADNVKVQKDDSEKSKDDSEKSED